MQPVGPLAAAVTNERTLALPIQSTASIGLGSSAEASPDPAIATPADVVAMPPGPPVQRMASGTAAAASAVQVPLPVAPPVPGVPGGAPLAPADRPATAAALAELPARTAATAPTVMADAMPSGPSLAVEQATQVARPAPVAAATVATAAAAPDVAPKAGPRPHPARAFETEHATVATQTPITRRGKPSPTVQFAAAATEEAAFAFWQDLSHRFPEALAQREPLVMRFKLDGTVFWRVRAEGFGTISEAQAVCARMRADGQDCFAAWS
jgi:hypothetical protein